MGHGGKEGYKARKHKAVGALGLRQVEESVDMCSRRCSTPQVAQGCQTQKAQTGENWKARCGGLVSAAWWPQSPQCLLRAETGLLLFCVAVATSQAVCGCAQSVSEEVDITVDNITCFCAYSLCHVFPPIEVMSVSQGSHTPPNNIGQAKGQH